MVVEKEVPIPVYVERWVNYVAELDGLRWNLNGEQQQRLNRIMNDLKHLVLCASYDLEARRADSKIKEVEGV